MFHSTEHTRTYPCASCGGQLNFDIASQKLRCPNCGNYYDVSAPNTPVRSRELQGAMQQLKELQQRQQGPNVTGMREVKCQNCGGETEFAGSLTATKCPYCATPIQRDDVHNAPGAVTGRRRAAVPGRRKTGPPAHREMGHQALVRAE